MLSQLVFLVITLSLVFSSLHELRLISNEPSQEIIDEEDQFVKKELERFKAEASQRNPVTNYLESLVNHMLETQKLNEPLENEVTHVISKIDDIINDYKQNNLDNLSDKLDQEFKKFYDIHTLYHYKWASDCAWIELRLASIKNNALKKKLSDIRMDLVSGVFSIERWDESLYTQIESIKIMIQEMKDRNSKSDSGPVMIHPRSLEKNSEQQDLEEELLHVKNILQTITFVRELNSVVEKMNLLLLEKKENPVMSLIKQCVSCSNQ